MTKLQTDLEKRYPEDTSVQFSYPPALRALEALNQGDPAKALEMTQAAAAYEFAVPAIAYYARAFFGALYPGYEQLTLSTAKSYRGWAKQPSRFLAEMGLVILADGSR